MSNLILTLTQPALFAWLLKATALLVLALAATTLLRRASAGTRHLVWLATLAGILLLPAVSLWTPVRLAIVPTSLLPNLRPKAAAVDRATSVGIVENAAKTTPTILGPSTGTRGALIAAGPVTLPPNEPAFPFWTTLLLLWASAASVLLGWLAYGALSVRRIVRSGRPLEERSWTSPLFEIADRLDLDAVPRLLSSPLIEMPFACGVLEPTIVLPASAEQWSDSRRRAVIFHELAHVRRRDLVGHTLGRLACALYWFHPLVWTAARHLRAESERACDDLVLSCGARASDYADHLLDIVISVRHQGAPATAMPMARRRELEGRVLAILDPAVARIGPGRLQSATLLAGLGALALSVAAVSPAAPKRNTLNVMPPAASHGAVRTDTSDKARVSTASKAESRQLVVAPSRAASPSATSQPQAKPSAAPPPSPAPAPAPAAAPAPSTGVSAVAEALGTIGRVAVREAAAAVAGVAQKSQERQGKQGVDSAKIALLLKVLSSDPDAQVRKMAAWGLSEAADSPAVVEALAEATRRDEDESVREMAAWALADSRRESARRALGDALRRDESDRVRETAAWALGNAGLRDDREMIELALRSDPSDAVRETAAWALGVSPQRPASRALIVALGDKSAHVRESAAWALAEIEDEDTAPAVSQAFMRETNMEVRMAELRALTFLHVEVDRSVLDAALSAKDPELRSRAVRMLAGSSGPWPQPRPRPRPRPMP
jgi:beta-lactamase regulating signal transducer with metallopeptidase domain/3-methyladenine DNA glycosylase AlkD